MNKISGIILTHNNEQTIREVVESIKNIIDELLIIDDFSTDKTTEIIKSVYPAVKIFQRKLDYFNNQRNFGIEKAERDWILMIDSDEIVSDKLKESIVQTIKNPKYQAYQCAILNNPFGAKVYLKMERPILFKKTLKFENALHEQLNEKNFGWLKGELIHQSWVDATDWIDDINHYSTHQAKKWILQNRNYNRFQLFLIGFLMPIYTFLKMFFWQKRFKNGLFAGFFYSLACSIEWIFSVLKYYEMKYLKKP